MSHFRNWRRDLVPWPLLAVVLMAVGAAAQSGPASIKGQVTDSSGGAIPALTVVAVDAAGAAHEVQTDAEGRYNFSPLAPGTYSLRTQLKGFADFEKTGVVVAPGRDANGECANGGGAGETADHGEGA